MDLGRWADDERKAELGMLLGAVFGRRTYAPGPGVSSPMIFSQSPADRAAVAPNELAPFRPALVNVPLTGPATCPAMESLAANLFVMGEYAPGSPLPSSSEALLVVDLKGHDGIFASGF